MSDEHPLNELFLISVIEDGKIKIISVNIEYPSKALDSISVTDEGIVISFGLSFLVLLVFPVIRFADIQRQ